MPLTLQVCNQCVLGQFTSERSLSLDCLGDAVIRAEGERGRDKSVWRKIRQVPIAALLGWRRHRNPQLTNGLLSTVPTFQFP